MSRRNVLAVVSGMVIGAVWPGFAATAGTRTEAVKQSLQVVDVSEHCIDEFDEDLIIYVTEGEKDCVVKIRVVGRGKSKSKVALEYFDSDDGWTRSDYKNQTTTTAGRATFKITAKFPTDPGSYCYDDDSYSHRFAVATIGKYRSFRSASFEVVYNSAEDNPACTGDDSSGDDEDDSYWDE